MIQQVSPIIATALLHSLYAGVLCYIVINILFLIFNKLQSFYKYHIVNMAMLVMFVVFLLPFRELNIKSIPAPLQPLTELNTAEANITPALAVPPVPKQIAEVNTVDKLTVLNGYFLEHSQLIMWMYIIGLFLFSARLLLQYINLVRLRTVGVTPANDEWLQLLHRVKERLNIKANIKLNFSERKISPCIIGHAKAVILIPVSIANNLTTEQAEAILLHELAHYKQYDHYINIIHQCIKCILFFNPFVWVLSKMADKYRELSCDEIAIRHDRNIELAETLAMIAGMQARHNSLTLNLKKNSSLLTRVQALLQIPQEAKKTNRVSLFAMMTVLLTVGLMMFNTTKLYSSDKDKLREQLQEISATMYKEGNHKYIVVDAVLDSLITLPNNPEVLYMGNGVLIVNGQQVPEKYLEDYTDKLDYFLVQIGEYEESLLDYRYNAKQKLTIDDILNSNSAFRQLTNKDKYEASINTPGWKRLFSELYKDGYIKKMNDTFSLDYGPNGIVVNHKKLLAITADKYVRFFEEEVGLNTGKISGSLTLYDLQKYFETTEPTGKVDDDAQTTAEEVIAKYESFKKQQLKKLSDSLFTAGNQGYSIVDAIIDGYINPYENFTVNYNKDNFSIVGKKMPANVKMAYETKLDKFRKMHDDKVHFWGAINTTIKGDVTDRDFVEQIAIILPKKQEKPVYKAPERNDYKFTHYSGTPYIDYKDDTAHVSSIDAITYYNDDDTKKMRANMKKLVKSMHEDKLLDSNGYYKIEYQYDGVYVNAKQLTGFMGNRYISMLNSFGYKPGKGHILERHPQGVAVPDAKFGNTVIHIPTHGENLPATADKMFTEGNPNFILAQALHDGVIKSGKRYNIMYDRGMMALDGKVLKEPYQSKYTKLMEDFFKTHKQTTYHWSHRGGGITAKELNDLNSSIRKNRVEDMRRVDNKYYVDHVIDLLAEDKLIDTNAAYQVKYNWNGLKVNGNKLSNNDAKKYTAILERGMGHKPKFPDDVISITNEP